MQHMMIQNKRVLFTRLFTTLLHAFPGSKGSLGSSDSSGSPFVWVLLVTFLFFSGRRNIDN